MRNEERDSARKRLDKELHFYRLAANRPNCTHDLLRAVRRVLGVPVAEMTKALGMNRSALYGLEDSEGRGTISLNAMDKVASAMGCKLVYAIVPMGGKTLEEMGERRKFMREVMREIEAEGGE
jgi:hypothetical protein